MFSYKTGAEIARGRTNTELRDNSYGYYTRDSLRWAPT